MISTCCPFQSWITPRILVTATVCPANAYHVERAFARSTSLAWRARKQRGEAIPLTEENKAELHVLSLFDGMGPTGPTQTT